MLKYSEDLNFASNKDMGSKGFFEMACNNNLSELHIVPTMHERKIMMFNLSDGFIALPGGMGTVEEIFEILTWAQLGLHGKPCGIINTCGYFDRLLEFLYYSVDQMFVKRQHREMVLVSDEPDGLHAQFEKYTPPIIEKWINKN